MNILITGATGLIGRKLVQKLLSLSFSLTVLTRSPAKAKQLLGSNITVWSTLDGQTSLDGFDAVINLAGEPIIGQRWSVQRKEVLCQSRWALTERLSMLIKASESPPAVFISGSAVGYYGNQGDAIVTEDEAPHAEFTHHLCQQWETNALLAESDKTRVCLCRTGIVLSPDGGALAKMLPAFRLGLGGPISHGRQYLPWIHIQDMVDAVCFLLLTPDLRGPFNLVSPYPVNNQHFSAILAEVLRRPALLRVPACVLKLALGEAATLLLEGQRALPDRLEKAGFRFQFIELKEALTDLLGEKH